MGAGYWEQSHGPSLMVGMLAGGDVSISWAIDFKALALAPHILQFSGGVPYDIARNIIVRTFLKSPAEWLLFLDSDIHIPQDGVTRMLSHKLPIVSALYWRRQEPHTPAMWKFTGPKPNDHAPITNYGDGQMVEADVVGAGALLIHRRVLERLPDPWFKFTYEGRDNDEGVSEDFYFCKKAKEAGFTIIVDTAVQCPHDGWSQVMKGASRAVPV